MRFGLVYLKALEYGSDGPIESGERVRVVAKSAALCAIFGATIGGLFNRWVSAPGHLIVALRRPIPYSGVALTNDHEPLSPVPSVP